MVTTKADLSCTGSVRGLAGQLVELVGRNIYHRRLVHSGRNVVGCLNCQAGRSLEQDMLEALRVAVDNANRDAEVG